MSNHKTNNYFIILSKFILKYSKLILGVNFKEITPERHAMYFGLLHPDCIQRFVDH